MITFWTGGSLYCLTQISKLSMNDCLTDISWGAAGDAELSGMLVREGGTAYFVGAMANMESNGTMKVGVWNHIPLSLIHI